VQPVAVSEAIDQLADDHLWSAVRRADARHDLGSLGPRKIVHTSPTPSLRASTRILINFTTLHHDGARSSALSASIVGARNQDST
jgi:hypothetical protein